MWGVTHNVETRPTKDGLSSGFWEDFNVIFLIQNMHNLYKSSETNFTDQPKR